MENSGGIGYNNKLMKLKRFSLKYALLKEDIIWKVFLVVFYFKQPCGAS